jgi:hypothetical protein
VTCQNDLAWRLRGSSATFKNGYVVWWDPTRDAI